MENHTSGKSRAGWRFAAPIALACAAALALAGCAPGASTAPTSTLGAISKTITSKPVSIVVADYEGPGTGDTIQAMIDDFMKLHPNVTIKHEYQTFADYSTSIKLKLSSTTAPDVVEVGQGHTMQAPLVAAGLLRPIDDYSSLYGWDKLYPGVLKAQNSVADGGKTFGTGHQYAVPLGGNMVGVYYNKAIATKVGVYVSSLKTLADFEASMATAKTAGVQPMVLGDQGAGPASHDTGALISVFSQPQPLREWIFGKAGATIDTPAAKDAFQHYQDWFKNGWLNADASGTAYQDAVARFAGGKSLYILGGSWLQPGIDKALTTNAGFFILPPVTAGDTPRAPGAAAGVYGISAKTKNADVAAAFIDFMANGKQAQRLSSGGFLPIVLAGYAPTKTGASLDDMIAEWNRMNANDGMSLFLDWATPSMGTSTYFPSIQELAAGKITPSDVTSRMQANWAEFNK